MKFKFYVTKIYVNLQLEFFILFIRLKKVYFLEKFLKKINQNNLENDF